MYMQRYRSTLKYYAHIYTYISSNGSKKRYISFTKYYILTMMETER